MEGLKSKTRLLRHFVSRNDNKKGNQVPIAFFSC